MDDHPDPLPASRFCNRYNNPNPVLGEGALGDRSAGRMYFQGQDQRDLVERVQMMLKELGYDLGSSGPEGDGVDGEFGRKTDEAVKQFQEEHQGWDGIALKVDGLVGPRTADALNRSLVGPWYSKYITPKELTMPILLATAALDTLQEGIILETSGIERTRLVLVSPDEHLITLLDSVGNRFSFQGEGQYRVLGEGDNSLAEGRISSQEDIRLLSTERPAVVELTVGVDSFTFYLDRGQEEPAA